MNEGPKEKRAVGLFGTCDNIPWRIPFIKKYDELGVSYFNPDAGDNWHPGLIDEENWHLLNDHIILFPVLRDSLGSGSLAEIGFSINRVILNIMSGSPQILISLIDDDCVAINATDAEIKRSIKDRKLVKSKLVSCISYPNINLVDSRHEMFDLSIKLYNFLSEEERKSANHNDL